MTVSAFLVILLAVIAGWVAVRQLNYGDRKAALTWALIVVYWVVLTAKNVCDALGV